MQLQRLITTLITTKLKLKMDEYDLQTTILLASSLFLSLANSYIANLKGQHINKAKTQCHQHNNNDCH